MYEVREAAGRKMVKLRCPPGVESKWAGEFARGSRAWTPALVADLGWSPDDDAIHGTFWLTFADLCLHFRSVYVCRTLDRSRWGWREDGYGAWMGLTAAGLPPRDAARAGGGDNPLPRNPQYTLHVTEEAEVCVTLHQLPMLLLPDAGAGAAATTPSPAKSAAGRSPADRGRPEELDAETAEVAAARKALRPVTLMLVTRNVTVGLVE